MGHVLFGFSGRINRARWWVTVLVSQLAMSLVMGLIAQVDPSLSSSLGVIAVAVLWIIVLWVWFAAAAKRLHDLNRTGAWVVLLVGGPFLLIGVWILFAYASRTGIMGGLTPDEAKRIGVPALAIVVLMCFAISIWSLIWLGCLPGTVGPNRYGADPLGGKR